MNRFGWFIGGLSVVLVVYGLWSFVRSNGVFDLLAWSFIVLSSLLLLYFGYALYLRGEA